MKETSSNFNLLRRFIRHQYGAVTIEFVFAILFLGVILAFMGDLVVLRSTIGKLDNVSYSLTGLLRERLQLHERSPYLWVTQDDLQNFETIAERMMFGENKQHPKLYVLVESLILSPLKENEEYPIKDYRGLGTKGSNTKCNPSHQTLDQNPDFKILSPLSEADATKKIPLYQVTVCVEQHSWFKTLVLSKEQTEKDILRSSSFAVGR
ncbi:tight adherence pilus pseudopilin TadF [Caviibacterium pharyngocola]|uniref:Protein TadF n=1 Tax=Caviibacterium pharyngocola TaxID=28159 RepID=A0A2M8RWW2_9PAST|nr:tight adherence pilus pseudopilin TadF [Caviibacterium pharyngocola]PJG83363.1 protein TadF [Caviibacterium pharyngocola]